jgi:hypothetical protein
MWSDEWQWMGGSGIVGFVRSGRFGWYRVQCGSDSIGRVVTVLRRRLIFLEMAVAVAVSTQCVSQYIASG